MVTQKKNSLPLDWTQLGKKSNKRVKQQGGTDSAFEWRCCGRRGCRHVQNQLSTSTNRQSTDKQILRRQFTGNALFCLHDSDPQWFQGYFFPSSGSVVANASSKPWRLLVTRQEIDECLECSEGGYRVVTLQVKYYDEPKPCTSQTNDTNTPASLVDQQQIRSLQQRSIILPDIEWTGGDMMDWNSPQVRFRAQRLSTGAKAEPMVQQIFGGLVEQARQGLDPETPIAELFPDLAIVAGNLQLMVPVDRANEQELYDLMMKDM